MQSTGYSKAAGSPGSSEKRPSASPPGSGGKKVKLALQDAGGGRPLFIAVWVPKGGVGKTTLVAHLAALLASHDIKVLVVDGDTQGSYTDFHADQLGDEDQSEVIAYFKELLAQRAACVENDMAGMQEPGAEVDSVGVVDELCAQRKASHMIAEGQRCADGWPKTCKPYTNLTEILTREKLLLDAGPLSTIHGAVDEFIQHGDRADLPVVHQVNEDPNLYMLAADSSFHDLIHKLPAPNTTADKELCQKAVLGLRWVLTKLCERDGYQLVLVDMGPGSDALNKMLLYTVDAVLPPFQADHHSYATFTELLKRELKSQEAWATMVNNVLQYRRLPSSGKWIQDLLGPARQLRHPMILPPLCCNYNMTKSNSRAIPVMDWAQAGFFQSVQVLLDPPDKKEREKLVDLVGQGTLDRFWQHGDRSKPKRQAVVAFLKQIGIMVVAHELGQPLTILSEEVSRVVFKTLNPFAAALLGDLYFSNCFMSGTCAQDITGYYQDPGNPHQLPEDALDQLAYVKHRFYSLAYSLQDISIRLRGISWGLGKP